MENKLKDFFKENIQQSVIFVDCFNTIILRKTGKNAVFKNWAKALEKKYKIKWQMFYRTYKNVNFWLCFKKFFSKFILQENFEVVLKKMCVKLAKKHKKLNVENFVKTAKDLYIQAEKESHFYNKNFINFLEKQKSLGKKICVVSDFYCSAKDIEKWLGFLGVRGVFDKVYSSCDFEKEKSTRGLYKFILKKHNLSAKDVLMVGDNFWSDFLMAKSCGLHTKRINNKRELKNAK